MEGFRICRIFGIDIELHWTWFLIFVILTWQIADGFLPRAVPGQPATLYWIYGISVILVFFLSLLFHEISHSVVARKFDTTIKRINLSFFGGAAQMEKMPKTAKSEFWMALAGPLSSLVAAAIFYAMFEVTAGVFPKLLLACFWWLAVTNVFLAVFNILPIFPMDGGRALRSVLWWKTQNLLGATKAAAYVALVTAFIVIVGLIFLWSLFSALFAAFIFLTIIVPGAFAEYNAIKNG